MEKIKLINLGKNKKELVIGSKLLLFSYEDPVAGYIPNYGYIKLDNNYLSPTSKKHILDWLGNKKVTPVQDNIINNILNF